MNILSVKSSTISNYERGISHPDYVVLNKLIQYFKVTVQDLSGSEIDVNSKSRYLINRQLCGVCDEKDKRITEIKERINEQSEIIYYFIKKMRKRKKCKKG